MSLKQRQKFLLFARYIFKQVNQPPSWHLDHQTLKSRPFSLKSFALSSEANSLGFEIADWSSSIEIELLDEKGLISLSVESSLKRKFHRKIFSLWKSS